MDVAVTAEDMAPVPGPNAMAASHFIFACTTSVWSETGSLNQPRFGHTAALLKDGRVFVTGGSSYVPPNNPFPVFTYEIYDPMSGTWADPQSWSESSYGHTSTLLIGGDHDGEVLVAGGNDGEVVTKSCLLFDPDSVSEIWSVTGSMSTMRENHTATLLNDGKVLVAGGRTSQTAIAGCEIYDPVTGKWSPTGPLNMPRCGHTATLLQDGRVIVAGGDNDENNWNPIASCEVYDPAAGSWSLLESAMKVRRSGHRAVLLPDGRLIAVGGFAGSGSFTESCEALDTGVPGASWVLIDGLELAKYGFTASLVVGNEILIAGGNVWDAVAEDCERLNPATLAWSDASGLLHPRSAHTATVLGDGRVLVAGGFDGSGSISSCELYESKGVQLPH